ncbi:hypothetical protein FRC08_008693 [Ceratobasidium sp. 394]|nr:hypothetical protein FRC08_008693 [Ceratobasidium sp. 394]
MLWNLGSLLTKRYEKLGRIIDLDDAIETQNRAVPLIPDGHMGKPILLRDLGSLYKKRYVQLGNVSDPKIALELENQALLLDHDNHPGNLTQPTDATRPGVIIIASPHQDNRTSSVVGTTQNDESGLTHAFDTSITSVMSIPEVISRLGDKGCANITDQLDPASYSQYPVSTGAFGDVYKGRLKDDTPVAIKTLRLHAFSSQESQKTLKASVLNHGGATGLMHL